MLSQYAKESVTGEISRHLLNYYVMIFVYGMNIVL